MTTLAYYTKNGGIASVRGDVYYVPLYRPMRVMTTFLPRALQPAPVAGRGGTSSPISLSAAETNLLRELNWSYEKVQWLISELPGWLYRIPDEEQSRLAQEEIDRGLWRILADHVDWSSAVALAGNYVLITERRGKWLRVSGIPADAEMTKRNINRRRTPCWVHRALIGNILGDFRDVFRGDETYSLLWERNGRVNDYPDGGLWIDEAHAAPVRAPLPWEATNLFSVNAAA